MPMSAQSGRHTGLAGLQADQWGVIFLLEDYYGQADVGETPELGPYRYHAFSVRLWAEPANTNSIRLVVQDSEDGETWENRYTHPADLVPGGEIVFSTTHALRHVRLIGYSTGDAVVHYEIQHRRGETDPKPIQDVVACTSFCQVACQTGAESATKPS